MPEQPNSVLPGSRIAVLMCTFNGEQHLPGQLASLARQSYRDWVLIVSDDGSSDRSLDLVAEFAARHAPGKVRIRRGPQKGFLANFLSVAQDEDITADYYAFCDQDDIWEDDHLRRGLSVLEGVQPSAHPARLYGGRTRLIDEAGQVFGLSRLFCLQPCFANALVQSYAGANTMIFNHAAMQLLRKAGAVEGVASHDWWLYLLVSAAGGVVVYDAQPTVRYRQHGANLQGHNRGLGARISRLQRLLKGQMRRWNQAHVRHLQRNSDLLSPASRQQLEEFSKAMYGSGVSALRHFRQSGVRRQGLADLVLLALLAFFGRL